MAAGGRQLLKTRPLSLGEQGMAPPGKNSHSGVLQVFGGVLIFYPAK